MKSELICNRSITFKEGNTKINSKELFGEIVVEDSKLTSKVRVTIIFISVLNKFIFIFDLFHERKLTMNYLNYMRNRKSILRISIPIAKLFLISFHFVFKNK